MNISIGQNCLNKKKPVWYVVPYPSRGVGTINNHRLGMVKKTKNIAGRLPENSRNRFVDRHSKKNSKKDRPKKFVFSLKADMLYFDLKSV